MPTPAGSNTNQYRCEACGRYFNTEEEFRAHRRECVAAKNTGDVHREKHPEAGGNQREDREWVSTP